MKHQKTILFLLGYFLIAVWSGIEPKDRFTWWLEVTPAFLGLLALAIAYPRFQFTSFTGMLILIHCAILFVGGKYTYAEVPLFDWVRDTLGQSRNNYDKVGHFAQGFVPALILREILIRRAVLAKRGWLPFFIMSFALALSAVYELLEWLAAIGTGKAAESFLGTQGYVWDTQSDMLLCGIGATLALLIGPFLQDIFIKKLPSARIAEGAV